MDSNDDKSTKSLFGAGSWMRKKRYENNEDYSLSPPADDTGFFHYQFGSTQNKSKHHESMFDRINKELSFSVENPNRDFDPRQFDIGSSLASSLLLEGVKVQVASDTRHHTSLPNVKDLGIKDLGIKELGIKELGNDFHKVFIPATILEKGESLKSTDLSQEISLEILKTRPEFSRVAFEDAESLIRKAKPGRPTRKISLNLEKTIDRSVLLADFQHLTLGSGPSSGGDSTPSSSDTEEIRTSDPIAKQRRSPSPGATTTGIQSPFIASLIVPPGIKERRERKVSAPPSLNPMAKNSNYFFSGGIFSSAQTSTPSSTVSNSSVETPSSSSHPVLQMRPTEAASLGGDQKDPASEPKPRLGKRRPKPSALREMNCWAPQSS